MKIPTTSGSWLTVLMLARMSPDQAPNIAGGTPHEFATFRGRREESPALVHINRVLMGVLGPLLALIPPHVHLGWTTRKCRWDCIDPTGWQSQHG